MLLSSFSGLALGTVAVLLLVTVALAVTRVAVRRLGVAPQPTSTTGPGSTDHLRSLLSDRVTDPRAHPRRPRAPGIA